MDGRNTGESVAQSWKPCCQVDVQASLPPVVYVEYLLVLLPFQPRTCPPRAYHNFLYNAHPDLQDVRNVSTQQVTDTTIHEQLHHDYWQQPNETRVVYLTRPTVRRRSWCGQRNKSSLYKSLTAAILGVLHCDLPR